MTDRAAAAPVPRRAAARPLRSGARAALAGLALACLAFSAPLTAQARAACTGVLRDAAGAPVAGATVTFAFAPSMTTPGVPDRVTATTTRGGTFAADLVCGDVYTVWATGPRDAEGSCATARPLAGAAAGWQVDLVTDARRRPPRVRIAGTAPWIAEGPLRLRVLVAGAVALGPDLVVPGDGPIALPPCPTDTVAIALVDGRGDLIDAQTVTLGDDAAVTFAPPCELAVLVVDTDGDPVAAAEIVQDTRAMAPWVDLLLRDADSCRRVVGTTGKDGRANVRAILEDPPDRRLLLLRASRSGYHGAIAGWFFGRPLLVGGHATIVDEDALQFRLVPAEPWQASVRGLPDDGAATAWCSTMFAYDLDPRSSGHAQFNLPPVPVRNGDFTPPPGVDTSNFEFRVHPVAARRDERCLVLGDSTGARPAALDLDALRTFELVVVDEVGAPARDVQVGLAVTDGRHGPGTSWLDRFALPADGRTTLRLPAMDLVVYATNGRSHGAAIVAAAGDGRELRAVLQPLPEVAIEVVDEAGAPVAGAGLQWHGGSHDAPSKDPVDKALDLLGWSVGAQAIQRARCADDGVVRVHVPWRPGSCAQVRAVAGDRRSDALHLRPGDAARRVVVR